MYSECIEGVGRGVGFQRNEELKSSRAIPILLSGNAVTKEGLHQTIKNSSRTIHNNPSGSNARALRTECPLSAARLRKKLLNGESLIPKHPKSKNGERTECGGEISPTTT